jgi:hypothetical protein
VYIHRAVIMAILPQPDLEVLPGRF